MKTALLLVSILLVLALPGPVTAASPAPATVLIATDCSVFSPFDGAVSTNTPLIVNGNFLDTSRQLTVGASLKVRACGNGYPYGYQNGMYAVVYLVTVVDGNFTGQTGIVFANAVARK